MSEAEKIAREFSARLLADLGRGTVAEAVEVNRLTASGCATHDHCDANLVMAKAFEAVTRREPASGEDVDLWNAAWSLARKAEFWMDEEAKL